MQDQINKLTEENNHLKWENKYIKEKYNELEEKTNYLIMHLKIAIYLQFKSYYSCRNHIIPI